MANYKDTEREELLDQVERLYIMGIRKPYAIFKLLHIEPETANRYLRTAAKRVYRHNKNVDKDLLFKKQMTLIDTAVKEVWAIFMTARNPNEKTGAINTLEKLLKNQAELCGIEGPRKIMLDKNGNSFQDVLNKLNEHDRATVIGILARVDMGRDEVGNLPGKTDPVHRKGDIPAQPESNQGELAAGKPA